LASSLSRSSKRTSSSPPTACLSRGSSKTEPCVLPSRPLSPKTRWQLILFFFCFRTVVTPRDGHSRCYRPEPAAQVCVVWEGHRGRSGEGSRDHQPRTDLDVSFDLLPCLASFDVMTDASIIILPRMCYILDRSLSAQMGKGSRCFFPRASFRLLAQFASFGSIQPYTIREDHIIRSAPTWHNASAFASLPSDRGMTSSFTDFLPFWRCSDS
jgi:hypothetical protein